LRALTAAQMREADAAAVARVGDVALMRAAGDALAEAIRLAAPGARDLVAFAGPGNNGGDAFAAFASFGADARRIVYAMPAESPSAGRRDAERRARESGVVTRPFPASAEAARTVLAGAGVALDALLGTGARAELSPELSVATTAMNDCAACVIAVDIPTGTDATTGAAAANAVRAYATVALGAPKIGTLLEPARAHAGTVYVGDIGIADDVAAAGGDRYDVLDDAAFLALVPVRGDEADKRSSGAPLVVAGSERYPGAAVLCARGSARSGAGYVTVAIGERGAAAARAHLMEQVVVTYDERDPATAIEALLGLTKSSSAVAIGPGLDASEATAAIVVGFVERLELPFVADASALHVLARDLGMLRGKRCVLTPHAGEFATLSGEGAIEPGTRIARLRAFVARTGITTLLKGNATLVCDGDTVFVNPTGTSALATAGTGDVLSGIIATLLAQGLGPADAARAGAYWHGLAGRYAARDRRVGIVAGDVADSLGYALPYSARRGAGRVTKLETGPATRSEETA